MKKYNEIYEENKKLDDLFNDKYPQMDPDIFKKNSLELMVEVGELANETRCFKYWSSKGPSAKEIVIDEYADCILMILMFCNYLDISLDEEFEEPSSRDVIEQFIYMYDLCSKVIENYNKEYIKRILSNFIYLGKLLNFTDEDIIEGCLIKINRNKVRLSDDFSQ
jgi:dimeric dUTPase (all-alpha-NTP-PPase superfamily)